ncbi:DNA polymerase III subunit beta [Dongshaea marina]|uniref:DNA polymerase III subunit beta n=1 Tax=Dongshaea marina TaxID=2047966 RepID=UPI000D3EA5FF|nr:DNA polymerase III subunit beta [Dongshaea marina]
MQFTVNRESLLRPLQMVAGILGGRPTLPVLSNLLFVVDDSSLSITATDLEVEMIGQLPLTSIDEPGRVTIPARKLLDICRALPEGVDITFSLKNERMMVRSGRSRYSLATLPAQDFPNIEQWESILEFELSQGELRKLIDATQFSMASQDVRYYLNGLLFETEGSKLRTVATDGHRMAMCCLEVMQEQALPEHQMIVPRKGVLELAKLLDSDENRVLLQMGQNNLRVVLPGIIFTTKLVDGRFPDVRRVIPANSDKFLLANRDALKQALARASVLSNEKFRGVRLSFSENQLCITANNPEQEEAEEYLDVEYQAQEMEIGFNVSYMLDILNTLKCETVRLALTNANSSALIEDPDNEASLYVIMPMRL